MTAPEPPAGLDLPGSRRGGSDGPGDVPHVAPRRLHPLSPIVSGLFFVVGAWPLAVIAIVRGAWLPMVAIGAALMVWQWLVWLRTSYRVGSDGLTVRSGIIWRKIQVVPPQRVQQVEVQRQLRHRVTGLAIVRIGLAGGGTNAEVELNALSERDAEELASTLERWRAHRNAADGGEDAIATPASLPPPARPPLLRLTAGQLVVGGLTSRSLWLAPFVALAAVVQFVNDSQFAVDSTDTVRSAVSDASPVLLLVAILLAGLVVAAAGMVVSHYGLVVEEADDDLVVRRGLLDRRTVTIPRDRVQYVELAAHVVRRRLQLASFDVRTADLGGGDGAVRDSSTSIPIGDRDHLESLIPELIRNVVFPATRRHPPAAVRRSIVRRSLRLVPISALVGLLVAGVDGVPVAAGVGVVVAVAIGWLEGRRLKSGWTETGIVTERGVIAWRRTVVPVRRVQSVGVSQNPFQRRLGLATVRLDVAGSVGGIELLDVATTDATHITELVGIPIDLP
jgi:putative membrane protein